LKLIQFIWVEILYSKSTKK